MATQISTKISEVLTKNGIQLSSTLAIELLALVSKEKAPKTPKTLPNQPLVGTEIFNPEIHTIDDITSIYCQWFKEYRLVKNEDNTLNFSKSTKSKTGYHYECKEAEKHWKAYAKEIAQAKEDILMEKNAVLDGVKTVEEAKAEISALESLLHTLETNRANKVNHPSLSLEAPVVDIAEGTNSYEDSITTNEGVTKVSTKKSKKAKEILEAL